MTNAVNDRVASIGILLSSSPGWHGTSLGFGAVKCEWRTVQFACDLRVVCVEFPCSFRYKSAGDRKEPRVVSESFILFPPFCLDVLNEQLWRGDELVPVRPKPFAVLA